MIMPILRNRTLESIENRLLKLVLIKILRNAVSKAVLYEYRFKIPKYLSYFRCFGLKLRNTGNIIHLLAAYKE